MILIILALLFQYISANLVVNNITVTIDNNTRNTPLLGSGNELVWQNVSDPNLIASTIKLKNSIGRYPGGTPSDYWNWEKGWASDVPSTDPIKYTPPKKWYKWANSVNLKSTVLVVNQLTNTLDYAIEGLNEHKNSGTNIKYVELGNEMYDNTRPDVLAKYPKPIDYALAMVNWTKQIKQIFPEAKIALIGVRWDTQDASQRELTWNKQVLQNPISYQADAATLHIYCNLYGGIKSVDDYGLFLNGAFTYVENNRQNANNTIPNKFRLWVTELGTFSIGNMQNTWLYGLYHGILIMELLTISRIDIILPYCLVCQASASSSLTTLNGSIPINPKSKLNWIKTMKGAVEELIYDAFNFNDSNFKSNKLIFNPNPPLFNKGKKIEKSKSLIGWFNNKYGKIRLIIMNIGFNLVNISLPKLNNKIGLLKLYKIYPKRIDDAINNTIGLNGLQYTLIDLNNFTDLFLEPYSLSLIK